MHFDDRLVTVLRLPASSEALARIQYRQLVDLLGRLPGEARSEMLDDGFARVEALGTHIPAADRARLLCQPLQPITNPRLISILAQAEPDVATAAITCARLAEADWLELIPRLPVRARGILRHRRDLAPRVEALLERLGVRDRGLPPVENAPCPDETDSVLDLGTEDIMEPEPAPEPVPASGQKPEPTTQAQPKLAAPARARTPAANDAGAQAGIGAIVRRIEEFRKAREAHATVEPVIDAPRLPLGDITANAPRGPIAVDFETDQDGRIVWADGPYAPSLVGLRLAGYDLTGQQTTAVMRRHLPLRAARVTISGAPAVSGEWQVDAISRFDSHGHFAGYFGRLRRPARKPGHRAAAARNASEADRMRQVLHELRTPANAIQVAAEIIQQQLYGPAPHEYRALAAAIAGDCAHILAGFEELDRLVKLETGALRLEPGECDVASVLTETVARLKAWTAPRRSGFALPADIDTMTLTVQVERAEAERLVWRLLAALAGSMAPEEILELDWSRVADGGVALSIALPAALAAREGSSLLDAPPTERGQTLSAGMFGLGFTLRLAAAEAAAAGGALTRDGEALRLSLPALTDTATGHSTAVNHSR